MEEDQRKSPDVPEALTPKEYADILFRLQNPDLFPPEARERKLPKGVFKILLPLAAAAIAWFGVAKGADFLKDAGKEIESDIVPASPQETLQESPSEKAFKEKVVETPGLSEKQAELVQPLLPKDLEDIYRTMIQEDPNLGESAAYYLKNEAGKTELLGKRIKWEEPIPVGNYRNDPTRPGWSKGEVITKGLIPYKLYQTVLPDGRALVDNYFALDPQGKPILVVVGRLRDGQLAIVRYVGGLGLFGQIIGEPQGIVAAGAIHPKKAGEITKPNGLKELDVVFSITGIQLLDNSVNPSDNTTQTPGKVPKGEPQ